MKEINNSEDEGLKMGGGDLGCVGIGYLKIDRNVKIRRKTK